MTNDEVSERAKIDDIEINLIRTRLRWIGRVDCVPDERPMKNLLYSSLKVLESWSSIFCDSKTQ